MQSIYLEEKKDCNLTWNRSRGRLGFPSEFRNGAFISCLITWSSAKLKALSPSSSGSAKTPDRQEEEANSLLGHGKTSTEGEAGSEDTWNASFPLAFCTACALKRLCCSITSRVASVTHRTSSDRLNAIAKTANPVPSAVDLIQFSSDVPINLLLPAPPSPFSCTEAMILKSETIFFAESKSDKLLGRLPNCWWD